MVGPDTTSVPKLPGSWTLDVSAVTQAGIRRLPFVLICVGGFVRTISRSKPFGGRHWKVFHFDWNITESVTDRLGDKISPWLRSSSHWPHGNRWFSTSLKAEGLDSQLRPIWPLAEDSLPNAVSRGYVYTTFHS